MPFFFDCLSSINSCWMSDRVSDQIAQTNVSSPHVDEWPVACFLVGGMSRSWNSHPSSLCSWHQPGLLGTQGPGHCGERDAGPDAHAGDVLSFQATEGCPHRRLPAHDCWDSRPHWDPCCPGCWGELCSYSVWSGKSSVVPTPHAQLGRQPCHSAVTFVVTGVQIFFLTGKIALNCPQFTSSWKIQLQCPTDSWKDWLSLALLGSCACPGPIMAARRMMCSDWFSLGHVYLIDSSANLFRSLGTR